MAMPRGFLRCIAPTVLLFAVAGVAAPRRSAVLVIPARYRIVQLAFDVCALRPLVLAAYQSDPSSGEMVLHLWNEREGQWQQLSWAQYQAGVLEQAQELAAVLLGEDALILQHLKDGAARWATTIVPIPTLDLQAIVNTLDAGLAFTPQEWNWLARRYDLKVKDFNEERRRYGRFGKPGEPPSTPPGKQNPLLLWWDQIRGRSRPVPLEVPMPPPPPAPAEKPKTVQAGEAPQPVTAVEKVSPPPSEPQAPAVKPPPTARQPENK
ncbi:MAG: hypothetical protein ACUVWX_10625 [Kiritimatiellia bacterium]